MFDALVAVRRPGGAAQGRLADRAHAGRRALERITAELVETKAAENVRYVEIRWGPLLHVARGLSLEAGIEAVVRGARRRGSRTGTVVRLIATALRSHDPVDNVRLAEAASASATAG